MLKKANNIEELRLQLEDDLAKIKEGKNQISKTIAEYEEILTNLKKLEIESVYDFKTQNKISKLHDLAALFLIKLYFNELHTQLSNKEGKINRSTFQKYINLIRNEKNIEILDNDLLELLKIILKNDELKLYKILLKNRNFANRLHFLLVRNQTNPEAIANSYLNNLPSSSAIAGYILFSMLLQHSSLSIKLPLPWKGGNTFFEFLLNKIDTINIHEEKFREPLLSTFIKNYPTEYQQILFLILNKHPNFLESDWLGKTPLHIIAQYANFTSFPSIPIAANTKVKDLLGNTPLHAAIKPKRTNFTEQDQIININVLIKMGFDIDDVNLRGQTSLMLAIESGLNDVAKDLIAHGATLTIEDVLGLRAIDYAEIYQRQKIFDILIEHESPRPHNDLYLKKQAINIRYLKSLEDFAEMRKHSNALIAALRKRPSDNNNIFIVNENDDLLLLLKLLQKTALEEPEKNFSFVIQICCPGNFHFYLSHLLIRNSQVKSLIIDTVAEYGGVGKFPGPFREVFGNEASLYAADLYPQKSMLTCRMFVAEMASKIARYGIDYEIIEKHIAKIFNNISYVDSSALPMYVIRMEESIESLDQISQNQIFWSKPANSKKNAELLKHIESEEIFGQKSKTNKLISYKFRRANEKIINEFMEKKELLENNVYEKVGFFTVKPGLLVFKIEKDKEIISITIEQNSQYYRLIRKFFIKMIEDFNLQIENKNNIINYEPIQINDEKTPIEEENDDFGFSFTSVILFDQFKTTYPSWQKLLYFCNNYLKNFDLHEAKSGLEFPLHLAQLLKELEFEIEAINKRESNLLI